MTSAQAVALERELSAAVAGGDAIRVLTLLDSADVSPLLQSAGQALLVVAAVGTAVPSGLARRLAGQLDGRGWDGDAELATLLRRQNGSAAS